jgi:hypothetical protein
MPAPQTSLGSSFWLPLFRMFEFRRVEGDLMPRLFLSTWLHALDAIVVSAFARSCVILALLAFCAPGSSAQGNASKLRVATRVVPPMVIEDKGALRGFSIDLWNSISARLDRETEYLVMSDVGEVLDAVGNGRADLGIAAISITSERESRFDFSQPILNAGLQILVRGAAENAEPSPAHLMRLFFSRTLLIWLGIALLLIMIPAHLVWVVERHHRNGIIPSRNYFPGIFHAMFWAAGTLATQADRMPRHWMAGWLPCSGCLRRWCSWPSIPRSSRHHLPRNESGGRSMGRRIWLAGMLGRREPARPPPI